MMSRFGKGGSYNHGWQKLDSDSYRVAWTVDRYVQGSRLRFPTAYTKSVDTAGVLRFCKKWDIKPPRTDGDSA